MPGLHQRRSCTRTKGKAEYHDDKRRGLLQILATSFGQTLGAKKKPKKLTVIKRIFAE